MLTDSKRENNFASDIRLMASDSKSINRYKPNESPILDNLPNSDGLVDHDKNDNE